MFEIIVPKGNFSKPVKINNNNWSMEYPYAPDVTLKIKHDTTSITLFFEVTENCTKAEITENNGKVWTDSCVEFFITFGSKREYYNVETTCAGIQLLGYRKRKLFHKKADNTIHASEDIIQAITKKGTYVGQNFRERMGDNQWTLEMNIPVSSFFADKIESLDGISAWGNFYKCGDNLTKPHYLSWAPISTPKPNFHVPRYFGKIRFEK